MPRVRHLKNLAVSEGGAHSSNAPGRVRGDVVGAMAEYWTVTQELLQGSDPMVRKPKASARPRQTADLDPSPVTFSKTAFDRL